jgi:AcrR family transcriptional regulator
MKDKLVKVKKEIILDAAKHLYFEKGYENTSIDEVAEQAGISKSTLYTYFGSKEEILARVFLQASEDSLTLYSEAVETESTGFEKLRAYSEAIYKCYENNPGYLNILDIALRTLRKISNFSSETIEIFHTLHDSTEQLITSMFELGVKDGSLRSDLDIVLARIYYVVTIQHIVNLIIQTPRFKTGDFYTALDYFLNGFVSAR